MTTYNETASIDASSVIAKFVKQTGFESEMIFNAPIGGGSSVSGDAEIEIKRGTNMELDHKHLIIDASVRKPPTDTKVVIEWLKRVVDSAKMKLVLGPFAHYCTAEGNKGIAGICAIETSHSSIHVWDQEEVPYIRFDLYSCSCFDVEKIISLIHDFDPYFYEWTLIDRNDNITIGETHYKQVAKIIDMLSTEDKIVYLEAQKLLGSQRSPQHKAARSKYATLRRKYSLTGNKYQKKLRMDHTFTLSCIKQRCKSKSIDFNLDKQWYNTEFLAAKAKYPKLLLHNEEQVFWSADVDRKDPNQGYTKDNCRIIPHGLNVAKWNWNNEELNELYELLKTEIVESDIRSFQ